ncbi:ATP-dependent DNA helicase [Leptolyngbya boryana CZ1]|uniref:ATP-dependent DNA helicase n=1 Tax=Leptolyngbya boryana CZ1 TaxID=3060204 RepID=A0AA97AXE9_LEPBY|nr:ATP-dependent DNA helicase [Leptolyngbya boryana]WNZ47306.1 ATP-dependent DNA helicase [Leptolyngbya boryana CZ1]
MIEVEVHQQLRAFLREQGELYWSHHLTMARLVARALRIGRSALIQTGTPGDLQGRYRLSYLVPLLMWQEPVVLVVPEAIQQRILRVEIPRLRQWIEYPKPIQTGDRWPAPDYKGILITTPEAWLSDRLNSEDRFPTGIPTIIDGVDDLESWTRDLLTVQLDSADWEALMLACPAQADLIRDSRIQLIRAIFQHPANPYECYLIEQAERDILLELKFYLTETLPPNWAHFFEQLQQNDRLVWVTILRQAGQFSLHCTPVKIASFLEPIWTQQPTVLIGGALDLDTDAEIYRSNVGLGDDLTCLKFALDRQEDLIQLYQPEGIPLPNTPQFQGALLKELRSLLSLSASVQRLTVILVGDTPLRSQVGSILAAEFGSRVQVERTCLEENGILVTGWEFWREHQGVLPAPYVFAIATLPIPSLEHPLVAGRVAYYKQHRQDWFRLYLLPEALSELQRSIAPVRECQGFVAILDSRVLHRSYGAQVLTALSPFARISYLDSSLFNPVDE